MKHGRSWYKKGIAGFIYKAFVFIQTFLCEMNKETSEDIQYAIVWIRFHFTRNCPHNSYHECNKIWERWDDPKANLHYKKCLICFKKMNRNSQ